MMDETVPAARSEGPATRADMAAELAAERSIVEHLGRIGPALAGELDAERLVQRLTDEATALVKAQFGAFFHNVENDAGESFMLYTLSGVPREAFSKLPMPRNTAIFAPTFKGEGVMRSDDITKDPRYGKTAPHHGMPEGHLPVRSYLAVPVRALSGSVLGGLFFGHAEPGIFTEREERAVKAVATIAGPAVDNARLFERVKRSEELARASESRLRLVSEASQEGIWYWDCTTNQIDWNDRLLELMGVSRETWQGRFEDWSSRLHPEDRPVLEAALKAHLEQRVPYRIESFRLRHADGTYRWCITAGQAEWDDSGRPLHMAGAFRDITEKKLAEDTLREKEHRYAQILDSVQDMIFCKDEHRHVTYANAATLRYYGKTPDQLSAMSEAPSDRSEIREQYVADDRCVFETGKVVERMDEPNLAPSGELRTFHTVKSPVFATDGRVAELVAVARDVTDRKRLLESQRLLAQASAILAMSLDYEATLANVARAVVPTFADWSAVDMLDESGNLRRLAVCHPDEAMVALAHELHARNPPRPDAAHGVPKVLRTQTAERVEQIPDELIDQAVPDPELRAKYHALGLKSYIVVPLVAHGKSLGAITFVNAESNRRFTADDLEFALELARRAAVAVDNARLFGETRRAVAERDRALDELRALADSLERRVEERTSSLLDANKELESFSYTVSHDLRAPIRHVSGFVDLLRARAGDHLDAKSIHYLDTVKAASTQMGALIDGLLAFSRLGRSELGKRPVSLDDLVRSIMAELEPDVRGRQIEWNVGELPTVLGDRTMLRLVLANLIANAVKYTRPRATAHITIRAEKRPGEVVLSVQDDGVGFNMSYAHKLFGVFQRLHSDDQFDGTGIGLATARRVIHRHGGRMWAESTEGQGASFFFSLPHEDPST
jgi:PAS domain S-box-containing protein